MAWYDYDEMRKHQSDSYEILSQYGEEGILEHQQYEILNINEW